MAITHSDPQKEKRQQRGTNQMLQRTKIAHNGDAFDIFVYLLFSFLVELK